MSTITKERLRERAREKVKGLELAVTQTAFADSRAELEEELELARIALASLEAEAVCVIDQSNLDYLKSGSDADVWPASRIEMGDVLLNRAAMLQGADGTLTNEGTIPVTQFKPVADLYGLTSPTGGETSFTFDAVEARDFIDGGWSCQEYVELGRFQEAMLQNGNSPAQSDCCPEQNYIAPAQDGNSPVIPDGLRLALSNAGIAAPESDEMLAATYEKHIQALVTWVKDRKPFKSAVIPDGWVLVPEEPTHEMLEAGDEQFGTYDVYRRMITAAPQQEVK
ncbi:MULTISPECIES: hypothetical protein [Enterobacter cloacae complex]|uniref:hypothetical protein n=1 Tax=Enterobacter cloacae complex TaxID=354276 RepID=UPI0007F8D071|nr:MULTISPECIES: hypothetical protein [Enterobacter cloacae complex]MCL8109887.1 hypothetical protein [Enterobacter hormaechei]MCM8255474.1 hypothetical protein [Enterobacter hormaechei]MCM8270074.1 hypothetical protein [Enterobacter hormaechei]MCM8352489.1 hypothetical protein [Enterobacter hormaechei]MCW4866705.1 hypothetical protein [Enterobacter hormaechei subsp. xiangfangensis]